MRAVLLLDNGSKRPESTLNLRRLADKLSERAGERIQPVSLLHSDQIPADPPGAILEATLARLLAAGVRQVGVIPLFFGPSAALTRLVPAAAREFGDFQLRIAPELCPLPPGEPRLAAILADQVKRTADIAHLPLYRVVLIDHGSPLPAVNAVRRWLAVELAARLGPGVQIDQAAMERRPGVDYDFNGDLLEDRLRQMAAEAPSIPIVLAMLFLSAGRHAGPGGDIQTICQRAEHEHPGLQVLPTPLIGSHPGLIEILLSRLSQLDWG